jgi:hypothetical protein
MVDEPCLHSDNRTCGCHPAIAALALNDKAALSAQAADLTEALAALREALVIDPRCLTARRNLILLEDWLAEKDGPREPIPAVSSSTPPSKPSSAGKFAIISFFFNWPTSGGGNIHTAELARFLARAGYTVRHFYPRYAPWAIGNVTAAPFPSEALEFTDREWNIPAIQSRLRQGRARLPRRLGADHRLVEHQAAPRRGHARHPLFLRFPALECLCPRNTPSALRIRTLSVSGSMVRRSSEWTCRSVSLDDTPARWQLNYLHKS